jgi:hypothetical protein
MIEPWQWALGACCAFLAGVAKTGAPGLGILVIPLMLYVIPDPDRSTGATLGLLCAADCFAVAYYRRHARWSRLLRLSPWVGLGLAMGLAALRAFDHFQVRQGVLTQLIGVIVLAMIAVHVLRRRRAESEVPHAWWLAALFGIAAGFATTIANAAGPIMNLYLLSMALPKEEFMGTGAWFFFIINLAKVPLFIANGRIGWDTAAFDLWLLPAIVIGALTGRQLFARVPQRAFEAIVLALATAATLALFIPRPPAAAPAQAVQAPPAPAVH